MSIAVMNYVWTHSKQKGTARLLMVAIADNANENGDAFPGIERLAEKTAMSERNVQLTINKLEREGELLVFENCGTRTATGYTNLYRIVMEDVKVPYPIGEDDKPIQPRGVKPVTPRQFPQEVKTVSPQGVQPDSPQEVKPVAPKPPVEPSVRTQDISRLSPRGIPLRTSGKAEEVFEEGEAKPLSELEQMIASASNAKSLKAASKRKLDTPITAYYDGKSVASPSPNTLFLTEPLFREFVTVLIENEKARFAQSSRLPPSRDHLVNLICNFGTPVTGWLAFKALHGLKREAVKTPSAAPSSSFLQSLEQQK